MAKGPEPIAPSPDTRQPTAAPPKPPSIPDSNGGIAVNRATGSKLPAPTPPQKYGAGHREDEIESDLIAKDLVMPTAIEMLDRTPAITVRGTGPAIESFAILRPFATVISSDRPTFCWTALNGATSYTVTVYDAALHLVGTSEPLKETQWSMRNRLKAGVVYTWIVTALKDGHEIIAPGPPARAEFKVLEKLEAAKLNRIASKLVSNAARGILYAEVGLLDDAETEFRTHLGLQPADERVKELLLTVKSWRTAESYLSPSPITTRR